VTNPTLTLPDVQTSAAGNYTVLVSNPFGASSNLNSATLNVLTFTATHTSIAYGSPGVCTVSCQVNYAMDRPLFFLVFQPALPSGWALQSVAGAGSPQISSNEIVFNGSSLPNPLNFSYTATVPGGQTSPQSIQDNALYFLSGMTDTSNLLASPSPLVVNHGSYSTVGRQGNQLGFNLYGDSGLSYILQASPDLIHWTNVSTITPVGGVIQTNVTMTGNKLFYRASSGH